MSSVCFYPKGAICWRQTGYYLLLGRRLNKNCPQCVTTPGYLHICIQNCCPSRQVYACLKGNFASGPSSPEYQRFLGCFHYPSSPCFCLNTIKIKFLVNSQLLSQSICTRSEGVGWMTFYQTPTGENVSASPNVASWKQALESSQNKPPLIWLVFSSRQSLELKRLWKWPVFSRATSRSQNQWFWLQGTRWGIVIREWWINYSGFVCICFSQLGEFPSNMPSSVGIASLSNVRVERALWCQGTLAFSSDVYMLS